MSKNEFFENETWELADGTYTGVIVEFKSVKFDEYVILKIKTDDDTIFMNYSPKYFYKSKPLSNLITELESDCLDCMIRKQVEFDIKNNVSKQGKKFSNITRIEYIKRKTITLDDGNIDIYDED